jgi:signal transduction histidine kinase
MKLFSAIFLLLSFQTFALQSTGIDINSIPLKGLLPDQGWKYKKGDNPEWASKHFNNTDWSEIDPNQEIAKLPEIFDNDIKWLKIQLNVKNQLKSFIETHFDYTLSNINIIPQDIGRVILNLINNAFYACAERSRSAVHERANLLNLEKQSCEANLTDLDYKPTVSITTQKTDNNQIKISVKDNGLGIPDAIKDKIFQPFFTTKPTGQGTGLGLSLAYDIVKPHGGELKVKSQVGEGAEFLIYLPI